MIRAIGMVVMTDSPLGFERVVCGAPLADRRSPAGVLLTRRGCRILLLPSSRFCCFQNVRSFAEQPTMYSMRHIASVLAAVSLLATACDSPSDPGGGGGGGGTQLETLVLTSV